MIRKTIRRHQGAMNNKARQAGFIPVSSRNFAKKLFFDDIMYIEKSYHDINFVTREGMIQVRGNSVDMRRYAKSCKDFYFCHSYLAVNLSNVISMENGVIFFDNGTEKSLGLKNFMKAKDVFANYIHGTCQFE